MAKKKVAAIVKIQIPAGKASPAPPVGTALGPHGVAIMDFVKAYNAATESQTGTIVPVDITIFEDRTFSFVLKTPPTPVLLRERAGLDKASSEPGKVKAGRVTEAHVEEVAEIKMPDLNAYDLEAAKQQVRGTARSMGIEVVCASTSLVRSLRSALSVRRSSWRSAAASKLAVAPHPGSLPRSVPPRFLKRKVGLPTARDVAASLRSAAFGPYACQFTARFRTTSPDGRNH